MGNSRYVKGKDGKFAGSVGEGKSNVPTSSPTSAQPATNKATPEGDTSSRSSVSTAFERYQQRRRSDTFTHVRDTTIRVPREGEDLYFARVSVWKNDRSDKLHVTTVPEPWESSNHPGQCFAVMPRDTPSSGWNYGTATDAGIQGLTSGYTPAYIRGLEKEAEQADADEWL